MFRRVSRLGPLAIPFVLLTACIDAPTAPSEGAPQLTAAAHHRPYVDQHQYVRGASNPAIGGLSQQVLAQAISAGRSGELWLIIMPVGCIPGAKLKLELRKVVGGVPVGPPLHRQRFDGNNFRAPIQWRKLYLDEPVRVRAGAQFAIVLSAGKLNCATWSGPAGDSYRGGDAWFDARPNRRGVWVPLDNNNPSRPADLMFETYVR